LNRAVHLSGGRLLSGGALMIPEVLSFGPTGFGDELLRGVFVTVYIAAIAFALGLVLGLCGAVAKLYGGVIARLIANFYTTVVRSIPELVLILFLYFAGTRGISTIGEMVGYGPVEVNGTLAAILVLGFVQGAYSTEVLRGAIQAVPSGQIEAARAVGMSPSQIFKRIVIPAMLPNAIPGLANLWLSVLKDTALIMVTGTSAELAGTTRSAAGFTKHYFTFYFTALMIYYTLTKISNVFINRLEHHVRRGQPKLA
jgi:polar amino acid transport system permease protein